MSELVEFIRGCLDADEQTARATLGDYAAHKASWEIAGSGVVFLGDEDDLADFLTIGDGPVAQHVARHDPARVLAEVNAKRAILDWAPLDLGEGHSTHLLRLLAQPYAGEPGWRDEWGTQ